MSTLACWSEPKLTRSTPSLGMGFSSPSSSERQLEVATGVGDPARRLGIGRVVPHGGLPDRLSGLGQRLVETLEIGRILGLDLLERGRAESLPGTAEHRQ